MAYGRLILLLAVATAAVPFGKSPSMADAKPFTFNGVPIHPGLVREFETWLSDDTPSITTTVDLSAAFGTDEYSEPVDTSSSGLIRISHGEGWYGYKPLGQMADGIHVLLTVSYGGGSGAFATLVFVRLEEDESLTPLGASYTRALMSVAGRFSLGDREDAKIEVWPDRVVVGPSRYRTSPTTLDFGR